MNHQNCELLVSKGHICEKIYNVIIYVYNIITGHNFGEMTILVLQGSAGSANSHFSRSLPIFFAENLIFFVVSGHSLFGSMSMMILC